MVLQRDLPIKIWGKGIPMEKVRASLAGAIGSTQVLEDSTWLVQLPPLPAGGQIRFFKVPKDYSAEEKTDVSGGEWKVANSENLPEFSAVAWFFAKRNHQEMNVPVGIIESNWGGTPVEGWTEAKVLAEIAGRSYTEESKEVIENAAKWKEILTENEKRREMRDLLVARPDSLAAGEVAAVGYNDGDWKSINLPADNPLEHIAWVRKKFNLSSAGEATLTLPNINQMAFLYVNGVQVHYKDWSASMTDLNIPGEILKKGQNVLTIRAVNTWNNKPEIGSKGEMYLTQNGKKINLEGAWTYSNNKVEPQLPVVEYHNWRPGFMFNAMIVPLTNYGIKGAIWYQGESNAGRYAEYRELFETMITNWRTRWGIGDFPFLFVQLANFMERKELQPDSNWAHLREAQTQTLELPNTGMATIIDIGEAGDIHPRNKKDVGERLWLQAKKVAFGEELLASGPIFKEAKREGNELILTFSETGEGLKLSAGEEVKGLIVEDAEGQFEIAQGKIIGPDRVSLTIPEGFVPVGIRYAWADNPEVNLINNLNLPARPFQAGL